MKHSLLLSIATVISCLCLTLGNAHAQKTANISQWSFGNVVHGDAVDSSDLKGKVVVVDYWGTHCPPCLALIPHLVSLDKRYKDDGLVIIAPESQGSSAESIKKIMEKNKVKYTVTSGCSGPANVRGLPHAVVCNRQGDVVFEGNPGNPGFETAIRKSLKEDGGSSSEAAETSTGPIVELRTWTNQEGKTIKAALLSVEDGKAKLRLSNSTVTYYEIDKLSESDQEIIKEALAKTVAR